MDEKWASFIYSAGWGILDTIGLKREFDDYTGRAQRAPLATATAPRPSPPRLPRATPSTTSNVSDECARR